MIYVKNVQGTSDNNPPAGYSSWKEYWEDKKGRKFSLCSRVDCPEKAEVGGHVMQAYGSNEWYIVPLCPACNNPSNTAEYAVNDEDLLRIP